MIRAHRRHLATLGAMAALSVPATLLAGCSAGQLAETSRIVPAVPGAEGDAMVSPPSQRISIRDATVAFSPAGYRAGGTAPMTLWVINSTDEPITLNRVDSSAGTVQTCGTASRPAVAASASAGGTPSASASVGVSASPGGPPASPPPGATTASPSASATTRPTASAGATGTAGQPAGSATFSFTLQPNQILLLGPGSKDGCLQIAHLARPLSAGLTVDADFFFTTQSESTHDIALTVPVGVSASAEPRSPLAFPPTA